jgi:hypothetical protein
MWLADIHHAAIRQEALHCHDRMDRDIVLRKEQTAFYRIAASFWTSALVNFPALYVDSSGTSTL